MRTFIDSSTIIVLSKIGELEFLRKLLDKIFITKAIEKELLHYNYPETDKIKAVIGDWIISVEAKGDIKQYARYGLGEGEATLFFT